MSEITPEFMNNPNGVDDCFLTGKKTARGALLSGGSVDGNFIPLCSDKLNSAGVVEALKTWETAAATTSEPNTLFQQKEEWANDEGAE